MPEHDPANQALVGETAILLTGVLPDLRASGLLTVAALQALPLDAARWQPGSMFRPLFDAVRGALAGAELIPAADGGHHAARDLRLCGAAGLHGLLGPGQLGQLAGTGSPLWFADGAITETGTPLLWHYLSHEAGVQVLTPAGFAARLDGEFLAAQPDEWIARLYAFLDGYPTLSQAAGRPGTSRSSGWRTAARWRRSARPASRPSTCPARLAPGCAPCGGRWPACPRPGTSWPGWAWPSRIWWPGCWTASCPATTAWTWLSWTRFSTPPTWKPSCGRWTRRPRAAGPGCSASSSRPRSWSARTPPRALRS